MVAGLVVVVASPLRPELLPTGFQLAGPAFSEGRLLDAAYALERAIGFDGSEARK